MIEVTQSGHPVHEDRPAEVNSALVEFLHQEGGVSVGRDECDRDGDQDEYALAEEGGGEGDAAGESEAEADQ
ncbi:hypothetical protein [Pseudonocardia sp. DLS-67]